MQSEIHLVYTLPNFNNSIYRSVPANAEKSKIVWHGPLTSVWNFINELLYKKMSKHVNKRYRAISAVN